MNWHLLPLSEVFQLLNTTPSGIDNISAKERLIEYGKNQIVEKKENRFTNAFASANGFYDSRSYCSRNYIRHFR